jgi:hypothetical protein
MFTRHRWTKPLGRTAPVEPGTGTADNGGAPAPAPAPAPAAPPVFDPNSLTPEARAWMDEQVRKADEKARTGTRDNAAKQATDELTKRLAEALGVAPKAASPEALSAEISTLKARNAELAQAKAISDACRADDVKADADLVEALLARKGKLKDLDPDAADFSAKIKALVLETVNANPRLKLEAAPAAPAPGGSAPVAPMNGGTGGEGRKRPESIAQALAESRAARKA